MYENIGEMSIYVAPAIGYIVGQGLEGMALKHIANNRQSAIPGHEDINTYKDHSNWLRRSIASVAMLGTLAGFCFAESATTSTTTESKPSTVVTVVDKSFGTYLDGTSSAITKAVQDIKIPRSKSIYVAAQNSSEYVATKREIQNSFPYGQPSTDKAVKSALNIAVSHSSTVETNQLGSKAQKNAGILVLTDNNTIGSPATIKAEDTAKLPFYIVNFGNNNSANATQLKQIATETNGQYVPVTSNPVAAIKKLDQTIEPHSTKRTIPGNRWPWIGMGVVLSAITAKQYFRRRKETAL
jgi:hypothetical protein